MDIKTPLLVVLFGVVPSHVAAVSMVEFEDENGISRLYVDGKRGHMESGMGDGYFVIDGKKAFHVNEQQRMVMDVSESLRQMPAGGTGAKVKSRLIPEGSGPRIAGYSTRKYRHEANGMKCGTLYTSKSAMKDAGVEHVLKVMHQMAKQASARAAQFGIHEDPCEVADSQLMGRFGEVGMPLRSLDKNGQVESEVRQVVKKATPPPNAFTYPKDFQVRDVAQMQREAQKQMRSGMPNMEEIMKHAPQDGRGGPPPGMEEQMRKLQEMMERYKQQ